ncbi:hypothetical protein CS022_19295 [Veronia nyctiphanis]|uniref:PKD domain-containing protein n=1 Tax=Veronia nyctiphanis TaxID=1278244 RepID=A0A4Q0YLX0_9GAMM|nr:PKD domain-containing protein [Veronia nyctiphanis]RXJ71817.1 hypothetical protein CS022_19295 [Veronia nyctiphanis]
MRLEKQDVSFSINNVTKQLCLALGLIAATPHVAIANQDQSTLATPLTLGTPDAFIQSVGIAPSALSRSALSSKPLSLAGAELTLPDSQGKLLTAVTENLFVEADGTLSIDGEIASIPGSRFILQGNKDAVYGWVILNDNDAYEYRTENGEVSVSAIAKTDVLPDCHFGNHSHRDVPAGAQFSLPAAEDAPPHIGDYNGEHVGKLQSRPGSQYVLLIDTRNVMANGEPYDVSKEFIWTTWQIVAASFSMLDINVTTDRDIYNRAAPSKRGGGTMYRQTGRSSCAFAFGTSTFCTLYREDDAYGQGRIAAHEFGHLFHLSHDGGQPGGEYHEGIADYQWVPVMGNIWFGTNWRDPLYQWSKGEYNGASNREDDFAILQRFVPFKSDDISGTKPLDISASGAVLAENNSGQIERNTDSDTFTFTIGENGGRVNLSIDRAEHIGGGLLDVSAVIRNSAGQTVAQSNNPVDRSASFNESLNAGDYSLVISGGAEGTPQHGFSKYSSLGYYTISGTLSGKGTGENQAPDADFTTQKSGLSVNFINASTDDKGVVSYSWRFGDQTTSNIKDPLHAYAESGTYTVTLSVADQEGLSDTISKSVTVVSGTDNTAPDAQFNVTTDKLTARFTSTATDDKAVTSHQWQFGDGAESFDVNPVHTYASADVIT